MLFSAHYVVLVNFVVFGWFCCFGPKFVVLVNFVVFDTLVVFGHIFSYFDNLVVLACLSFLANFLFFPINFLWILASFRGFGQFSRFWPFCLIL